MTRTRAVADTVDGYLKTQPEAVRQRLSRIRASIRKAVPKASESISYAIPAFKYDGKPLLYFAAFKAHIGLYPMTGDIKEVFAADLAPYPQSKGTVRFPHDVPVPYALIGKLAKHRAREIIEAAAAAKTKSKAAAKVPVKAKGRRA